MLSNQMDSDVQVRLNSLPKPILNVKILNYLQSVCLNVKCKQINVDF
jgi:hypothetical protein